MIEKQTLLDLIDKLYDDLKPDELIASMGIVAVIRCRAMDLLLH